MERDPGAGPGASWSLTLPAGLLGGLEPSGHEETFLRLFLVILAPSTCVWPWGKFQGHPHVTPISRALGRRTLPRNRDGVWQASPLAAGVLAHP